MKKIPLLIVPIFLLVGCVTTKTTGFVDPDYRDVDYQISTVVVRVLRATMEETQIAEQKLTEKFNAHNVKAIKFTDIVPPTRSYEEDKIAILMKEAGADSVFSFFTLRDTVQSYVPPTYHAGATTSQVNTVGNHSYVTKSTAPGYISGGYSTSAPIMVSSAWLIDLNKGKLVWKAEGEASGNELTGFSDLLVDIGTDAIDDLVEKGILQEASN